MSPIPRKISATAASCHRLLGVLLLLPLMACVEHPADGIAPAQPADTTVVLDFFHKPLPDIPLPNDLATRYDASSATGLRINASMLAATTFERRTRELVDQLDGWGCFSPISVGFSQQIDPQSVIDGHHGDNYATANDVVYVVDVTPGSPTYGQTSPLDVGNGNFPIALEQLDSFWEADPRGQTNSLLFEEVDEDTNHNGKLDPGEDTDLDGRLDKPNYLPSETRQLTEMTLAERADALMTFYERETRTLILRPLRPLRQRTTYAVIVTRRLLDAAGKPVGSPFPSINHTAQTDALTPLLTLLATHSDTFGGLTVKDIAFTWTFTTGTMTSDLMAVRDGLYGLGPQRHLAKEFPAKLSKLHRMWDDKPAKKWENPWQLSSESFFELNKLLDLISTKGQVGARMLEAVGYVDFHAVGTYLSPQLMPRKDADGRFLGYNQMTWPMDVHSKKATAVGERVTFWLTVPRKESSARKDGKPVPVVVIGHGYTSSKFEVMVYHAWFARHGMACISIDNAGHGLVFPDNYNDLVPLVLAPKGMLGAAQAVLDNRSWDQDADGAEDSGADFWTAYTFHTRDNVRQTTIDYMQLIRVVRGWDGVATWDIDINGNGKADDIAGDFDGDGKVDVGGPGVGITMTGSSLGGIMSAMVGGSEPQVDAVVPIAGGAGLADVGIRSIQGGVKEAVELRMMGPLYIGQLAKADKDGKVSGEMVVSAVVPRLNGTAKIEVARLPAAVAKVLVGTTGASVLAENLDNGEYDCARALADGSFRVALASDVVRVDPVPAALDKPDKQLTAQEISQKAAIVARAKIQAGKRQRHRLRFFAGDAFQLGVIDEAKHRACKLKPGAIPIYTLDKFGKTVAFHAQSEPQTFLVDSPLAPLAEGLGLHRGRPELRRFMGFAQLVLDAGDPAIWAQHAQSGELTYRTGETVKTNMIVWHNVGDMNVPVNTGAAIARAAGLLDVRTPVPAWDGRTVNQVLIDGHVLEAVDKIPRWNDAPNGMPVVLDPEDLSGSATPTTGPYTDFGQKPWVVYHRGKDGFHLPRLSPPLRTHAVVQRAGGWSGLFVPMMKPSGQHDPDQPGTSADRLIKACEAKAKVDGADASLCAKQPHFDVGMLTFEMLARYLKSGGTVFALKPCQGTWSCGDVAPRPAERK